MKVNGHNNLFIGRGIHEPHLPFIIEFCDAFSSECKIARWIIEKPFPDYIINREDFSEILAKYEIKVVKNKYLYCIARAPLRFAWGLVRSIIFFLSFDKQKIISNRSWYLSQIMHSILDQCRNSQKDGEIRLRISDILKASIKSSLAILYADLLIETGCNYFFLGHTVYDTRSFLAKIRKKARKVIIAAGFTFHVTYPDSDGGFFLLNRPMLKRFVDNRRLEDADEYFSRRCRGYSNYADSNRALKHNSTYTRHKKINVIFLHVFRDSPFYHIDLKRVFIDYVDWILTTLEVLACSDEQWLIKEHPSAELWGESQTTWMEALTKAVYGKTGLPSNVVLTSSEYSNIDLLCKAKRVVTYAGSVHMEAACLGVKPITIAMTALESIDPSFVLRPNSRAEYRSMLLRGEDNDFKLGREFVETAVKVLYSSECCLNFRKDVSGVFTYRNEPKSKADKEAIDVLACHSKYYSFFRSLGHDMSYELERSCAMSASDELLGKQERR